MGKSRYTFTTPYALCFSPLIHHKLLTTKRRYSDNQKAETLAVLDANNGNLSAASRATGTPANTIAEWERGRIAPDVTVIREQKRNELKDELETLAHKLVFNLTTSAELASFKEAAIALGIVIDKMQLLAGKPTVITDDAMLSDPNRVERIRKLLNTPATLDPREQDAG